MRIFAGPNGSGKTTIIKSLLSEIPFGVYVNIIDTENVPNWFTKYLVQQNLQT